MHFIYTIYKLGSAHEFVFVFCVVAVLSFLLFEFVFFIFVKTKTILFYIQFINWVRLIRKKMSFVYNINTTSNSIFIT